VPASRRPRSARADAERANWWNWKIDPYAVDAVLGADAVREGLFRPDRRGDPRGGRAVRRTTIDRFGPVRTVVPSLVFELGFEGIRRSGRHKSGIAVRFPRMLRWRHDKPVAEADTPGALPALL
jgi:DNA ligase-1